MAARQVGMPETPLLIYPRDLISEETPEQLEEKAASVADQAAQLLLKLRR
jgi:hypothetical protein